MKVLSGLLLLLAVTTLLANGPIIEKRYKKEKQESRSTKQRAEDMFRTPSSEEAGKIPDKYQPIDHKIKTKTSEEKE